MIRTSARRRVAVLLAVVSLLGGVGSAVFASPASAGQLCCSK